MQFFTWKKIRVVLLAIVLIGAAITALQPYRFWAWASDLQQVAGVSYDTAIAWELEDLGDTQFLLDECDIMRNCKAAQVRRLNKRKNDLEEKIKQMRLERKALVEKKGN